MIGLLFSRFEPCTLLHLSSLICEFICLYILYLYMCLTSTWSVCSMRLCTSSSNGASWVLWILLIPFIHLMMIWESPKACIFFTCFSTANRIRSLIALNSMKLLVPSPMPALKLNQWLSDKCRIPPAPQVIYSLLVAPSKYPHGLVLSISFSFTNLVFMFIFSCGKRSHHPQTSISTLNWHNELVLKTN